MGLVWGWIKPIRTNFTRNEKPRVVHWAGPRVQSHGEPKLRKFRIGESFSLGTNPKVNVKKYILERASNKIKYEFLRRQPTNWHSADHC